MQILRFFYLFILSNVLLALTQSPIFSYFSVLIASLIVSTLITNFTSLQRLAISISLIIGLSPFYLILRGFLVNSKTTNLDLQIYLFSFIFLTVLSKFIQIKFSNVKTLKLENIDLRSIIAGFSGLLLLSCLELYLLSKSVGNGVAWVASGDSKNHFVNAVQLIDYGNLDPRTFLTQPVSAPAFLSLLISQKTVLGLSNAEILSEQIQIYAHFWVLLTGALGLIFSALFQSIWNLIHKNSKKFPIIVAVLFSMLPLISLIIGSATYDGFFTAIFGIATTCTMIIWFLESVKLSRFSVGFVFLGCLLFISSLMAWMFIIPFTGAILILGIRNQLQYQFKNNLYVDFFLITGILFIGLTIHFSPIGQSMIHKAKAALSATGAVNVNNPNFFFTLVVLIFVFSIVIRNQNKLASEVLLTLGAAQLVSLIAFKFFSNLTLFSWNYYLLKYQWIMVSAMICLTTALVVSVLSLAKMSGNTGLIVVSSLIFIVVFTLSESLVATNRMWQRAILGWQNPSAQMMNKVLSEKIDYKNPTMFFRYGYAGNATLGNFWINSFADPIEPIKGWNYTIDTDGDANQLCELNAYYPTVSIITADPKLGSELSQLCPEETFIIKLEKPVY